MLLDLMLYYMWNCSAEMSLFNHIIVVVTVSGSSFFRNLQLLKSWLPYSEFAPF